MNSKTISYQADEFLSSVWRRSFSYVGALMLIRAHLTLAPGNRLSRAELHRIFNTRTPQSVNLITEVIDLSFKEDSTGVFSPAIDRAAAAAAEQS